VGRLALTIGDRLYRVDAAGVLGAVTGTGLGRGPSDVPAAQTNLATVMGMCVAPDGVVYVSEWVQVRKVDAQGVLREVIARDGVSALNQYAGDGGPALDARFDGADGVAVDRAGNLFVSDSRLDGARVRRVDASTGRIDTVAGGAVPGVAGAGGLARDAQLAGRGPLAIDPRGNVLFCDRQAHRVVRIGVR